MYGEKAWRKLHKNDANNIEKSAGGSTPQSSSCKTTYHPLFKLSNLNESDMQDTAGKVGKNSWVTYSSGPPHMDEQGQDNQLEPTYSSSVPIRDVALKTCRSNGR